VLLQGETGTGKDMVARAIHDRSARRDRPFIPIHLGALPGELVASELFRHNKGAFTGATSSRQGKFEMSDGGTVYLDEIATLEQSVQISLLRLLETMKFYKLGGKREIEVDVRIIAATNEDLQELVEQGRFREDLYYRLEVFPIQLPPLREREGDLELLAHEFLRRYREVFDKQIERIDPSCMNILKDHDWPGNIRELKNVVQRAVLVCNANTLRAEHLPPRFRAGQPGRVMRADSQTVEDEVETGGGDDRIILKVGSTLEQMEREMIVGTLKKVGDNRKEAAKTLGISRRSLYNKLRKYNID
jgi:DNA-binding NtrC family response regulator